MRSFDHIIVGSGQATGTLLGKLIPTGDSIAVIEGADVGGTCVNTGCTPTKALVASARAIHQAGRGSEFGFSTGPVDVDFDRVRERMNDIRQASNQGLTEWMEGTENVTLIRGWATFEDNHTLSVNEESIHGTKIYINTGTRAVPPPIDGLDDTPWLDNASLLDLETLPDHLIIIGGGYIGIEFAQIFRRFGSRVTVLQRDGHLMPREDEDVADAVQLILEEEGIRIVTGAQVKRLSNSEQGVQVICESETITGSHILIAAGRRPNSNRLGLENTDIKTNERGYIQVDDHCQTAAPNVYAVGDVNGQGAFTHTSVNDAEIVLDHLFGGPRTLSTRHTIYALFTDPPLGRVGMTEKEAIEKGHRVLKATHPMAKISRAKEMSETEGFAKLLVDADTDLILGASILGPGADEIINMFATIMHGGLTCKSYRQVVLVHPTVSELLPWTLDKLQEVEETSA